MFYNRLLSRVLFMRMVFFGRLLRNSRFGSKQVADCSRFRNDVIICQVEEK